MADNDLHKLLDYIISHPIANLEALSGQLNSDALEPADQVSANVDHDIQTEREAADRMGGDFAAGLRAAVSTRTENSALVLDDTNPVQDAMASALIRFLVKPNLATAETSDISDGHYRYTINIDWPALDRLASSAGVNLTAALS